MIVYSNSPTVTYSGQQRVVVDDEISKNKEQPKIKAKPKTKFGKLLES